MVVSLEESIRNGGGAGAFNNAMEIENNNDENDCDADGNATGKLEAGPSSGTQGSSKKSASLFTEAEAREMLAINNKCLEFEEEFKRSIA